MITELFLSSISSNLCISSEIRRKSKESLEKFRQKLLDEYNREIEEWATVHYDRIEEVKVMNEIEICRYLDMYDPDSDDWNVGQVNKCNEFYRGTIVPIFSKLLVYNEESAFPLAIYEDDTKKIKKDKLKEIELYLRRLLLLDKGLIPYEDIKYGIRVEDGNNLNERYYNEIKHEFLIWWSNELQSRNNKYKLMFLDDRNKDIFKDNKITREDKMNLFENIEDVGYHRAGIYFWWVNRFVTGII